MIQLKDIKRGIFLNADKYFRETQKDKIVVDGFELKVGCRLKAAVTNDGKNRKFYMTVISLDPAIIAYWVEGEYAVYIEPVDFNKLFKKRDINKRTTKDQALHPSNFRVFSTKALNAGAVRELLWHLPRLQPSQVTPTPNSLVLKTPQLIHDFAKYVTADKEDILTWMLNLAIKANNTYHQVKNNPILSDDAYDDLKEFLLQVAPKQAAVLKDVGAPVAGPKREKIELTHPMGSQEKIKPGGDLLKFVAKSKDVSYVASDKLDGISLQFGYNDGQLVFAATRGKGLVGQNVLRHAKHLKIPQTLKGKYAKGKYSVRCEGILTQEDFKILQDTVYKDPTTKEKYNDGRTMVGGCLNRTVSCVPLFNKLRIISYCIMNLDQSVDKEKQLQMLKEMGFQVVHYQVIPAAKVSDKLMVDFITSRKDQGGHELDGAVLEANSAKVRTRMGLETNSLNPAYSRAFKTGDTETAEMEVKEVECNVSKQSLLIPKIIFKTPTRLGGVMVKQTAAFNYAYIRDNKIGPGAIILMTRAGDVIPYAKKIVKGTTAQFPDPKIFGNFDWDDTEVNLVLTEKGVHADARMKTIIDFFVSIGAENFKAGTAEKFYNAGYDTIDKIIEMKVKDILAIEGIQSTTANKLYGNIHSALGAITLPVLAGATPFFGRGFGETRMNKIYEKYGEEMFSRWSGMSVAEVTEEISTIPGFKDTTARLFAKGINSFKAFLKRNKDYIAFKEKEVIKLKGSSLKGMSFLWSKCRNHSWENPIEQNGGEILQSFKKGTTYLICPPGETSGKIEKARTAGTKIFTPNQLETFLKSKGIL
jgi:NAD-dependent DNA ligase